MTENPDKPPQRSLIARSKKWIKSRPMLQPDDTEDVIEAIQSAHRGGVIGHNVLEIIKRVIRVENMTVNDVMIPRPLMVTVSADSSLEDILKVVTDSGHSRFPVIDDTQQIIHGILLAKDILAYHPTNGNRFELNKLLREPVFVVESKRLSELLNDFRKNRNHMAVVVDEYGGIDGLVTIEDVLEEIVGEIEDESDIEEKEKIVQNQENEFIVDAFTSLEEINQHFRINIDEDVDTIGGLVVRMADRVPKVGDTFSFNTLQLEVLDASARRVRELKITPTKTPAVQK